METDPVEKSLWNEEITKETYGSPEQYYDHIMEQYKLYVSTVDQVTSWRNSANAFFLSIHTLILAAITLAAENGFQLKTKFLVLIPLAFAWVLCYVWWRLIKSYRQLNSGKFKIIEAYEDRLPTRPFVKAEWKAALVEGKDSKIYQELTQLEKYVPIVFGILYAMGAVMLIGV